MLAKFEVIWTWFAYTSFTMQNLVQKLDFEAVLKWLNKFGSNLVESDDLGA